MYEMHPYFGENPIKRFFLIPGQKLTIHKDHGARRDQLFYKGGFNTK
jgi:hypothetical protein